MKKQIGMVIGILCATAEGAIAAPSIHCVGNQNEVSVELEITPGYGYDASYVYLKNGAKIASGYSHGGSFTVCASRAASCNSTTTIQYTMKETKMIFTASHLSEKQTGTGEIAIYGDDFSSPANAQISVNCAFDNDPSGN